MNKTKLIVNSIYAKLYFHLYEKHTRKFKEHILETKNRSREIMAEVLGEEKVAQIYGENWRNETWKDVKTHSQRWHRKKYAQFLERLSSNKKEE